MKGDTAPTWLCDSTERTEGDRGSEELSLSTDTAAVTEALRMVVLAPWTRQGGRAWPNGRCQSRTGAVTVVFSTRFWVRYVTPENGKPLQTSTCAPQNLSTQGTCLHTHTHMHMHPESHTKLHGAQPRHLVTGYTLDFSVGGVHRVLCAVL